MMTKDLLIIGAVVALVAIMILAALPEITSAMPEVYYVEPTEPETAVEAKAETVLQSTASVRYALTAAERDEVERVVMAEAGAEPYIGQMAVAQCILNACEQENARPPRSSNDTATPTSARAELQSQERGLRCL